MAYAYEHTFYKTCPIEGYYSYADCLMLAHNALGKTGVFISPTLEEVENPTVVQQEEIKNDQEIRQTLVSHLTENLRSGKFSAIAINLETQEYLNILSGFWGTQAGADFLSTGGLISLPSGYDRFYPQFLAYDKKLVGINLDGSFLMHAEKKLQTNPKADITTKKPITQIDMKNLEEAYKKHILTIKDCWSAKDDEGWVKNWLQENAPYAIHAQTLARELRSEFLPRKYKRKGRPKKFVKK